MTTQRVNVSATPVVAGTYAGPWGDYIVRQDGETTFFWCSRGTFGLHRTWDDHYAVQDHPAATTRATLNSIDTLAPGDTFAIEGDPYFVVFTVTGVNPVAKTIDFTPPLPTGGWPRGGYLSRGGNWLDRNGVFRGTAHSVQQPISSADITVDISAIDGDLFCPANLRLTAAYIDSQPADAFLLSNASGGIRPYPVTAITQQAGVRTIIRNPTRGNSLRLVRAVSTAMTLTLDKVAGATVPGYPWVNLARADPDIWSHDFSGGYAALHAAIMSTPGSALGPNDQGPPYDYFNKPKPFAYEAQFLTDSELGNMPFLRFSIPGYGPDGTFWGSSGLAWVKTLPAPVDHVFFRFAFRLHNYAAHVNDNGVKFPGVRINSNPLSSDRYELMAYSPANPDLLGMSDYAYNTPEFAATRPYPGSAFSGPVAKRRKTPRNVVLREGVWYLWEMETQLYPGRRKAWVNGNVVLDTEFDWTGGNNALRIVDVVPQFYHGGKAVPSKDRPDSAHTNQGKIVIDIAMLGISSRYMGPPQQILDAIGQGEDMSVINDLKAQLAAAQTSLAAVEQESAAKDAQITSLTNKVAAMLQAAQALKAADTAEDANVQAIIDAGAAP